MIDRRWLRSSGMAKLPLSRSPQLISLGMAKPQVYPHFLVTLSCDQHQ